MSIGKNTWKPQVFTKHEPPTTGRPSFPPEEGGSLLNITGSCTNFANP